jgi:type III secretory pathway component EscV
MNLFTLKFVAILEFAKGLIILLSIIGVIMTRNVSFFGALAITMIAIYFYYTIQTKNKEDQSEGFENPGITVVNDPRYNKQRQKTENEATPLIPLTIQIEKSSLD